MGKQFRETRSCPTPRLPLGDRPKFSKHVNYSAALIAHVTRLSIPEAASWAARQHGIDASTCSSLVRDRAPPRGRSPGPLAPATPVAKPEKTRRTCSGKSKVEPSRLRKYGPRPAHLVCRKPCARRVEPRSMGCSPAVAAASCYLGERHLTPGTACCRTGHRDVTPKGRLTWVFAIAIFFKCRFEPVNQLFRSITTVLQPCCPAVLAKRGGLGTPTLLTCQNRPIKIRLSRDTEMLDAPLSKVIQLAPPPLSVHSASFKSVGGAEGIVSGQRIRGHESLAGIACQMQGQVRGSARPIGLHEISRGPPFIGAGVGPCVGGEFELLLQEPTGCSKEVLPPGR